MKNFFNAAEEFISKSPIFILSIFILLSGAGIYNIFLRGLKPKKIMPVQYFSVLGPETNTNNKLIPLSLPLSTYKKYPLFFQSRKNIDNLYNLYTTGDIQFFLLHLNDALSKNYIPFKNKPVNLLLNAMIKNDSLLIDSCLTYIFLPEIPFYNEEKGLALFLISEKNINSLDSTYTKGGASYQIYKNILAKFKLFPFIILLAFIILLLVVFPKNLKTRLFLFYTFFIPLLIGFIFSTYNLFYIAGILTVNILLILKYFKRETPLDTLYKENIVLLIGGLALFVSSFIFTNYFIKQAVMFIGLYLIVLFFIYPVFIRTSLKFFNPEYLNIKFFTNKKWDTLKWSVAILSLLLAILIIFKNSHFSYPLWIHVYEDSLTKLTRKIFHFYPEPLILEYKDSINIDTIKDMPHVGSVAYLPGISMPDSFHLNISEHILPNLSSGLRVGINKELIRRELYRLKNNTQLDDSLLEKAINLNRNELLSFRSLFRNRHAHWVKNALTNITVNLNSIPENMDSFFNKRIVVFPDTFLWHMKRVRLKEITKELKGNVFYFKKAVKNASHELVYGMLIFIIIFVLLFFLIYKKFPLFELLYILLSFIGWFFLSPYIYPMLFLVIPVLFIKDKYPAGLLTLASLALFSNWIAIGYVILLIIGLKILKKLFESHSSMTS